jgi:hypothetical protein
LLGLMVAAGFDRDRKLTPLRALRVLAELSLAHVTRHGYILANEW